MECTLANCIASKLLSTYYIGHTKKRPGQPETAGNSPEQPGTARVLEITSVVLDYCLNRIVVEIIME